MLHDLSENPVVQLLVNETRRAEVKGPALAEAHRRVGAALALVAARRAIVESVEIRHVTGPAQGMALAASAAPLCLALMRAGLFMAEGLWASLPGAALVPWDGHEASLATLPIADRPVIVVDAVINTGRSVDRALELVLARGPAWVTVAALVANADGLAGRLQRWPSVEFAIARISAHSYVGKGGTDTGARLFGTTNFET
ncbi:MAG: hypothetical protein KC457_22260 [Myxococcales bacterium]|nr:hypothetical protein [Myxococcales bacterium]